MSKFFPKRVKDLPPLEPDSEDEKTPAKMSSAQEVVNEKNRELFSKMRIPKRVSELPPLESDSDDDCKNDRLNCAILDDSFLLTPSKSIMDLSTQDSTKENDKNSINKGSTGTNCQNEEDLLPLDFDKMEISEKKKDSPKDNKLKLRHELFPSDKNESRPPLGVLQNIDAEPLEKISSLATIDENLLDLFKSIPNPLLKLNSEVVSCKGSTANRAKSDDSGFNEKSRLTESCTTGTSAANAVLETPFKNAETNFITPQIKSYQMPSSRRARFFNASTTQKSRTVLENEFRSQKILFQTPIGVSRPPVATIANDSISLSLDDTIKNREHPAVEKKISPIKEYKNEKSSAENLFLSEDTSGAKEKEKIVVINGKEFVLLKKLGSGGSSSVFLAQRKDNKMEVALKIVDLRGDKTVVEGYLNETRLLAKLQGNVNVVSLYEYEHIKHEFKLYMIMEKGDSDLHKILQSYKTDIPLYTLMKFWYQMLQSVNYIHENGVIHSDLKPANFLMVNGRLKLIDFGIASNISVDSTSIIKFSAAGTYNYISPEALIDTSTGNSPLGSSQLKVKISTKSDVWSLGCILYLLLYKKTPFGNIKNIYAKINAISNPSTEIEYPPLASYYPAMLIDMTKACLKHNPKRRPSVAELLKYPFEMVIPIPKDSIRT